LRTCIKMIKKKIIRAIIGAIIFGILITFSKCVWGCLENNVLGFIMHLITSLFIGLGLYFYGIPWVNK